jgi:hypothetical protein
MPLKDKKFKIIKVADIVFLLSSNYSIDMINLEEQYRDFHYIENPDVIINTYYEGIPHLKLQEVDKIFDSQMIWSLYHINEKMIFKMKSPITDKLPYRIAIFENSFMRGEVYNPIRNSKETVNELLPNPLEFPLSEVLMVCLLAQGRGLMIHACGIDDDGKGYLFAGNSTHGKSTMAKLWKNDATILNDDRIVIRHKENRFWIYGTPWHGEYTGVSPQGVPVEKIFFLNHAESNNVIRCNGANAASMLLARSFPPLWDSEGMKFTLDFCSQLVSAVPCYKLNFMPDENIVDFIRCVK